MSGSELDVEGLLLESKEYSSVWEGSIEVGVFSWKIYHGQVEYDYFCTDQRMNIFI